MPLIVNLSSIHQQPDINIGIEAFTKLCNKYSTSCWACCPGIFTRLTNKAWVALKYQQNLNTVINPYKLGKLTTEQFLDRMLNIFYFLKDDNIHFSQKDIDRLWQNKETFISLKGITQKSHLTNANIAKALIEEAWSAIVTFSEADLIKFEHLTRKDESIYFISNTNELNIHKLLHLLQEKFPDINWYKTINISIENNDLPVEIAPNIYLYLSYRLQSYKTVQDNQESQNSTPCLLKKLVEYLPTDSSNITVISQYPKDLDQAKALHVPDKNVHLASNYYPTPAKTLSQVV